MSGGTFNVCRSIWDHPVFAKSEFSEREAFLWLVSEASWKPRTARVGNVVVDLGRGQLAASVRFMADAWGWSKSRVGRFLERLKNRDVVRTESGTGVLVITLCNYEKFQGARDSSGTAAGQQRDTSGTNEKKGKKDKKDTPPTPPAGGRDRGSRLPADWRLPREWGEWAMSDLGMSESAVRLEAAKFADHWRAQAGAKARKADWLATWRNWCRNSLSRQQPKDRRNLSNDEDLNQRGVGRDLEEWARRNADANERRDSGGSGHHRQAAARDATGDMPGVLAFPAKEDRPVPFGDVQAGRDCLALLALRA